MRAVALRLTAACLVVLASASSARAQDEALTLEMTFQGDVTPTVQAQLRETLHAGLTETSLRPILDEAESQAALGEQGERLMGCGSDPACLAQAGVASSRDVAIVAGVSAVGEIYTFTIDIYDLATGQPLHIDDAECPLCTVNEAQDAFRRLARTAGAAVPPPAEPEVVAAVEPEIVPDPPPAEPPAPETVMLYVRAQPEAARILVNGAEVGLGIAELEVAPGTYPVRVEADGYVPVEQTVTVAAGNGDQMVRVALEPQAEAAAPPATGGDVVRRGGALEGVDTTALGSVLAGTGAAALVTGIVLLVIDGDTTCSDGPESACPEVYDTGVGGALLTILGSAAITSGAVLLLWDTLAGEPVRLPEEGSAGLGFGLGLSGEGALLLWGSGF